MLFEAHILAADYLYESVFGYISPILAVFGAINRIQANDNFAPPYGHNGCIAINNLPHPGFNEFVCFSFGSLVLNFWGV